MRWFSHLAMAWAVGAPLGASPSLLLGATAPDWLEGLGRFRHREETHILLYWVLLALTALGLYGLGLDLFAYHLFWFAVGGLLHWLGDALTPHGVPLAPWSPYRTVFFGGRLRTGEAPELVLCFGLLFLSYLWGWSPGQLKPAGRWSCLLVRAKWCEASQQRVSVADEELFLASPAEVRQHRFDWP